jgi:hypothetical protein
MEEPVERTNPFGRKSSPKGNGPSGSRKYFPKSCIKKRQRGILINNHASIVEIRRSFKNFPGGQSWFSKNNDLFFPFGKAL